jgi:hypothetical protein
MLANGAMSTCKTAMCADPLPTRFSEEATFARTDADYLYLAQNHLHRGHPSEAIRYLDSISKEHKNAPKALPLRSNLEALAKSVPQLPHQRIFRIASVSLWHELAVRGTSAIPAADGGIPDVLSGSRHRQRSLTHTCLFSGGRVNG